MNIITKIGYSYDVDGDGTDESCVSFAYPDGENKDDTCYVPLFMPSEARTGELPYMPFIELTLVDAPSRTHNISGDFKFDEAYIDFNIYAANSDEINQMKTWMEACKDEVIDKITDKRHSVSNCTWMEVVDTGREIIENIGKKVVFHHVVSIYTNGYQSG
jgi:hypothetical protein